MEIFRIAQTDNFSTSTPFNGLRHVVQPQFSSHGSLFFKQTHRLFWQPDLQLHCLFFSITYHTLLIKILKHYHIKLLHATNQLPYSWLIYAYSTGLKMLIGFELEHSRSGSARRSGTAAQQFIVLSNHHGQLMVGCGVIKAGNQIPGGFSEGMMLIV